MNPELNEKERDCVEIHHHSIEAVLARRTEPYTVLFREKGWGKDCSWYSVSSGLKCTANKEGQHVVLFGHFTKEQVVQTLRVYGMDGSDFSVTQVTGRHHMDLPFLPCNM